MLKAMIVDDDQNVIECLKSLIPWQELGSCLVASACDGQEAYGLAIEHEPDLIICDVVMPVMDGNALCKKIYETMSDVTFIFLSAYEDFTTAQIALQYHVRDYILKPLTRSKIDYIANVIRSEGIRREKDSFYLQLMYDREMEKRVCEALKDGDAAYFERLFHQLTEDVINSNLDIGRIRSVIYRLLNMLYSWLDGTAHEAVEQERRETFERMEKLKFKMDLIFLASEQYFGYLRAAEKSSWLDYLAVQVKNYVDEHFRNPMLTASSVAEHFNYSPSYVSRMFSQSSKTTLNNYIAEKRIGYAAHLLAQSVMTVNDIAEAAGYQDASYFGRAFKRRFNLSPREYRQKYAETGRNGDSHA